MGNKIREQKEFDKKSKSWADVTYLISLRIIGSVSNAFFLLVNKGQLLAFSIAVFMIIAAIRTPADQLGDIVKSIASPPWWLGPIGWLVAATIAVLAFILLKKQRTIFTKEIDRVSKERTELQKLLNLKPGSSK